MSERSTVHVSGIAPATSDKEVQDFFSFCGKITNISVTPVSSEPGASKSATVTFEKDAAAKTAILLDQTQLGPSAVNVQAAQTLEDIAGSHGATASEAKDENNHDLEQEDKPKSRIIAEYLAHGYTVSDGAIQKAIALDQKHGFSNRFTSTLSNFDQKYHASDKARGFDESYKLSDKAASGWRGLNSYFTKALGTPSGRKLHEFYVKTDKQVRDIHTEARRLADLKSGKPAPGESGEAAPAPAAPGSAEAGNVVSEPVPAAAPAPATLPTGEAPPATGAAPPADQKA